MAHNIYNMSDKRYSDLKRAVLTNQSIEKLVQKTITITGKKRNAVKKLVLKAMLQIEAQTGKSALEVFEKAVENSMPLFNENSPTKEDRAEAIALRWIINCSMEEAFDIRLARNIIDAAENRGIVVSRKNELLKKAAQKRN